MKHVIYTMKKSRFCLIAAQFLLLATANVTESQKQKDDCNKPFGRLVRTIGPNIATNPNSFEKCLAYDDKGCVIGYQESIRLPENPNAAIHNWILNDGCLKTVLANNTATFCLTPAAQAVNAFPEIAAFANNPHAFVLTTAGNNSKTDPGSVTWKASGSLRKVNYIEVRCAFLVLVDPQTSAITVLECLSCHYFLGTKKN